MTQEDKAKAYDNIIEKANKMHHENCEACQICIEELIPELAESEDERIRKALIEMVHDTTGDELWVDYNVHKEDALDWLEKQGDQKPADKVEPKFHEGEWIVQGRNILKIRCVGDEYYCFETVGGYVDSMLVSEIDSLYHLWTIQDAKDGDVLVTENKNIFIFKSISDCTIYDYCGLYFGKFENSSAAVNGSTAVQLPIGYVPATKEQRDTLMKAMADAGYTFNFDKKELKKIEQKPAWSEEDDNCLSTIIAEFSKSAEKSVSKDEWMRCNDWLNSLRDRVQPQPRQEWSEDEEQIKETIRCALLSCCKGSKVKYELPFEGYELSYLGSNPSDLSPSGSRVMSRWLLLLVQ